ncbi:MAG: substrate-binding domain-containing protein [Candidatus Latescibacteria bacterium]|nr:substrate-binding domain-containing protein [Candidatus Latescibacterota bacterium]
MRHYLQVFILLSSVIYLWSGCGESEKKTDQAKQDKILSIAVIPKGTTHEFWKSIHAGALKAEKETGVKVVWKGPLKEDDREEQLQIVETFIAGKIDAIVLAPLDNRSLVLPVREAKMQNIPTIIIDSDIEGDAHVSFVATDNYKGGVLGADRIGELMKGKGKLLVLRYQEGSASTTNREAGFLDTIKSKYPGIEILSDNQYAGATTESAYRASENLLNRFTNIDAIFTPNESSTFGCLRALQDRGLTDSIIFVGFDSSQKLVEALEKSEIKGLVLQNPFKMGYLGVKLAAAYLRGEKIEPVVDTGVMLATPENMNDPEIKQLLSPDLSQYLDN